jgi:hypothetical protein
MQGLRYILLASIGILLVVAAFVFQPKRHDTVLDTVGISAFSTATAADRKPDQAQDFRVETWNRTPVRNRDETRKDVEPLNNILFEMKDYWDPTHKTLQPNEEASHASVIAAVDKIQKFAADNPRNSAAQYYAAISEIIKPSRSLLWRLGGIVQKSEHIYFSVIGSLKSFVYNKHLYSRLIRRGFDYLTIPDGEAGRFEKISDVQQFLITTWLPAFDRGMNRLINLYIDSKSTGDFEFSYDRSIAAGGDRQLHTQDRHLRFIRPYLGATIFYGKQVEGGIKAFVSYDLDEMPAYLSKLFAKAVLRGSVQKVNPLEWFGRDGKNVHVNTPADYFYTMASFPTLYNLRKTDMRAEALRAFQEAQKYNLEYIGQMRAYAQLGEQGQFIVDAKELVQLDDQAPERYEKLARATSGTESWTDPLTGRSVTTNFPALFSLKGNLRYYFPQFPQKQADARERIKIKTPKLGDLYYFYYEDGKATTWNDETINGFISGAGLFEAHRILSYSDDGDVFGSTILPFFM